MKKIVRGLVGATFGLYFGLLILLNIPWVQQGITSWTARTLSHQLGSHCSIGNVSISMLNRIIITNLTIDDLRGEELLHVTRLSAKFDLMPLLNGRISISNVQLFGFHADLKRDTPEAKPNYQFIANALASKDTVKKESRLDLRINSLLLRRGRVAYHVASVPTTPGKFNSNHLYLKDIVATLSLKALSNDSINASIKRMSLEEEESGFNLKRLSLKVVGNQQGLRVENFGIELPHTNVTMDTLQMSYDSLGAFSRFATDVRFHFRMLPSQLTPSDLSAFVPTLKGFHEPLQLEFEAKGPLHQLNCPLLRLEAGPQFNLQGDFSFQDFTTPEDAFVYGHLSRLHADPRGVAFLFRNLNPAHPEVPPLVQRMGTISFNGEVSGYFSDLVMYGRVRTDVGTLQTDVKLSSDKERQLFAYSGSMKATEWDLQQMLNNKKLGRVTFNLGVDGQHVADHYPTILLKGDIKRIDYSGYPYEHILLDGEYKEGGFNGQLAINDPNGILQLNGAVNTASPVPTFNFQATVSHVKLNDLHLTENYPDTELSLQLRADFTGGHIDEMNGEINIDNLEFLSPEKNYAMSNLRVTSITTDTQHKRLTVNSPSLRATIEGSYSYRTLPLGVEHILSRYLPALIPQRKSKGTQQPATENDFGFDIHLQDAELFSTLFHVPLTLYAHSTVKGYVNDRMKRLRIEAYLPRLRYKQKFYESAMLLCENPADRFRVHARFNEMKPEGAVNVSLEASARGDSIHTKLNWGNSGTTTYSGRLDALAQFTPAPIKTTIQIRPTDIILNDTVWNIHPATVEVDSGKIHIHDFAFSNNERHLHIDGTLSKSPEDTLRLDLNRINIGYVFDIADLGINFCGEATGPAVATNLLSDPYMQTDLFVKNLGINDGIIGDANLHGEWHNKIQGLLLDAHISEGEDSRTHVSGYVYPIKPTSSLDLQIKAHRTNLQFIHYYINSITPEFSGRATGDVHLYGKFKALTLDGAVDADAAFKIDVLNTTYHVKDSILITPDGLTFPDNRVIDPQGHEGHLQGYVRYNHFKDMNYNFNFRLNNTLLLNTRESHDSPFYGTVYGTGSATLRGNPQEGLNIDLALSTNRNSTFTYLKDNVTAATSNQFIKFVDKTPRRKAQESTDLSDYEKARQVVQEDEEEEGEGDIRLNLIVDATPDATMRIIMDPIAGDYISGRGSGNIRAEFYNKGDFKMFGNYNISQGSYKFSLQEVIRKDFTIKAGSNISFNGIPEEATLDMQAVYTVNSASLNDLLPSSATASDYISQTNVKVNCLMDISGQLTSPEIKMDLELPNERDEIQALVRNYIPTDEQMNMQILYLLSIGKFYTPEYVDVQQNSNMMSSMLSSTLSGQLNNALSHIIDNNNWNVGTNLSTGQKGWTDMEFEGVLSGQLLNNRLLINGNFGYRDNPLANTNFVGDFEAEWLVTRSGDIRLKAYNETNDRYYTRTNLTTQGIGIIFRKDFNHWKELMFWNKWRLKRLKAKQQKDEIQPKAEAAAKREMQHTPLQETHQ